MAKASDVLEMLIPEGGWYIIGEDFAGIVFVDCNPITEEQFIAGFDDFDAWKAEQETTKANEKAALLNRLGITADEAALLLS